MHYLVNGKCVFCYKYAQDSSQWKDGMATLWKELNSCYFITLWATPLKCKLRIWISLIGNVDTNIKLYVLYLLLIVTLKCLLLILYKFCLPLSANIKLSHIYVNLSRGRLAQ